MAVSQPPTGRSSGSGSPDPAAVAKIAVRDRVLTTRRRRTLPERQAAAEAIAARVLALPELGSAATVAAYVAVGSEPGTALLLDALRERGHQVLLPVLRPDLDLDWAPYFGAASLAAAPRGLLEPSTAPLGREAVAAAGVVLVPGLAVDDAGVRLGRGGGSYDRALARVPAGALTAVLLHEDEVGVAVPAEPHDRRVRAAITPVRVHRFG
ncbi:5-formyltetrahydrofolate cyclo-ligase [Nocardioides sp.]|uniref:5-formyltetrahydrofolate cyclo-ligase n=1 Tax=Nocardioides sp. TaxID=35761 RepID=UPI003518DDB7